jgi:hypothetical protein
MQVEPRICVGVNGYGAMPDAAVPIDMTDRALGIRATAAADPAV